MSRRSNSKAIRPTTTRRPRRSSSTRIRTRSRRGWNSKAVLHDTLGVFAVNEYSRFFGERLQSHDPVIASEIALELRRQQTQIELIASENIVSSAVLEA